MGDEDITNEQVDNQPTEVQTELKEQVAEKPVKEEIKETKNEVKEKKIIKKSSEPKPAKNSVSIKERIKQIYDKDYKKLLILPVALFLISLVVIGIHFISTGEVVDKDVSLKGGITITIPSDQEIDAASVESLLTSKFPDDEISVRSLRMAGQSVGIIIESNKIELMNQTENIGLNISVNDETNNIILALEPILGKLNQDQYTIEEMGSRLGASFFREAIKAIYMSFLLMGVVVFLYFGESLRYKIASVSIVILSGILLLTGKTSLTKDIIGYALGLVVMGIYIMNSSASVIVILNTLSDFVITVAAINISSIKLSTAGIAALLMVIGYSVDTNILLTTKVLKRKEGTVIERILGSMKTGMTMTLTTMVAILVALFFSQSEVIKQIMTILLIGMIADIINTWILNTGILRLYLEKKVK